VPVAVTVVVAKLPSHGLFTRPGLQSQTVPAESVCGTAVVVEADASDVGKMVARSEKTPITMIEATGTARLPLVKGHMSGLDVKG
jgi:hypothetical protein